MCMQEDMSPFPIEMLRLFFRGDWKLEQQQEVSEEHREKRKADLIKLFARAA